MYFNRSLTSAEIAFIVGFLLIYSVYLGRTSWLARRLRTTAPALILKFIVRTACFGLLVLALLEPSFGEAEADLRAVGRDIFLLMDVSRSMDAADVQPSRIEKAKFELLKLLDAFPNDRFGLVVFSAQAYLQCPLTTDHSAVRLFLESLSTRVSNAAGTAFAPALELVVQKVVGSAANQSKAIVLVSDGEDFGPDDRDALRLLRRNKIPVLTVGVGTRAGAGIAGDEGILRDEDGNRVVTRLTPEPLQRLARDTNGAYFELANRRNDMPALAERLARLESKVIDQRKISVAANKYGYFLVGALLLLSLDVLVTVRTIRL
jgi:Ca-activated chloride channel family protein